MAQARLMDQPADFVKLGIDPDKVEKWEDGIRNTGAVGNNEVWYFDGNFDDGSKVIIGFRSNTVASMRETGFAPNLNLDITRPNGETTQEFVFASMADSRMSTEQCDVHFGPDWCTGDFQDYTVHIEGTETLACDLHYHALTQPFRQGTSEIALGDNDEYFYTDLCVPKCDVTGTLTYDGQTVTVHGRGYHDHQWMNITPFAAFHHWFWGRMYTKKYVVYLYDFVCSAQFDFKKIPFFIVADNTTGKILFQTNGKFDVTTELEMTSVGKRFPKVSHYVFDNGDKKASLDIKWHEILETRDTYGDAPADREAAETRARQQGVTNMEKVVGGTREQYDAAGIQPTYMRFYASGSVTLTQDGKSQKSDGDMIYEYNYLGKEDDRAKV